MAEVIGAELHLESVRRFATGDCHHSGIVYEDVQAIVPGAEPSGEIANRRLVGEVEACKLDLGGRSCPANTVGRFCPLRLVTACHDHERTCCCKCESGLVTEAAVCPRDECRMPRKA